MKRKLFARRLWLIAAMVVLSACSSNIEESDKIAPHGEVVSRDFEVEGFTAMDIDGGAFDVIWRQGESVAVTVEMYENLFDFLEVSVQSNTLHINSTQNIEISNNETRPRIYIYSPYLASVNLDGAVNTVDWDTVQAQEFSITVSGAGNIAIPLEVETLDVYLSGAGLLDFLGHVDNANVALSGAGNIDLVVSTHLNVDISGAGRVRYTGNPTIEQDISGIGRLEQK